MIVYMQVRPLSTQNSYVPTSFFRNCWAARMFFDTILYPSLEKTCGLRPEPGSCFGYFQSWYFDAREGHCKRFVYGGCGGNDNRFNAEAKCMKLCKDFKGKRKFNSLNCFSFTGITLHTDYFTTTDTLL